MIHQRETTEIMECQDTTIDDVSASVEDLRLAVAHDDQSQSSHNSTRQLQACKCFLDLPIELQIIIWEHTFPERRLIQFSIPLRVLRQWPYGSCVGDPPLPIALHVCRLSRKSILKYWRLVYEHHLPYYENYSSVRGKNSIPLFPVPRHRPICFNPKVDQICIDASEMHEYRNYTDLQKVVAEFRGCLDDIQVLEVYNVIWVPRGIPYRHPPGYVNDMGKYARFEYGVLNFFRNLKELHLISSMDQDSCVRIPGSMSTRTAHVNFMKWYRAARDLDPECSKRSVPEISFHCYREKQVLTDEQRRNWTKILVTEESGGPSLSQ
ncbi:hypothetical protein BKA64DRAFT_766878 [Cadophora sp. MPI-SDFR-AT-0126]|nr:hypothetical protein BKA64DRAFT_766878 [Leotiomycetes sp. MPI-SDFR-AT-0126]